MNIRQLQALRAVIETHTTTRAAEKMGLTQPAVSGLISSLEKTLNLRLFSRVKGRLLPTPEALRLADEASSVLSGFSRMEARAKRLGELKAGELKIATLPGPGLAFIPQVIAKFVEDKPDVKVHLHIRPSAEVREWIASEYMDLGLVEQPFDTQGLDYDLMTMRCVCVVPESHPLAVRPVLTPTDLDGEPFIALDASHMTYSLLAAAFQRARAHFNVRIHAQLFSPACVLVASGAGVAVVDPISAQAHCKNGLVAIPFEPVIPFPLGLVRPIDKPLSLLATEFRSMLIQALEPYLMGKEEG